MAGSNYSRDNLNFKANFKTSERTSIDANVRYSRVNVRGAGANGNRALALGVVGGMTVGTIALLYVVPAFFIVFQGLHERFQGSPLEEVKE